MVGNDLVEDACLLPLTQTNEKGDSSYGYYTEGYYVPSRETRVGTITGNPGLGSDATLEEAIKNGYVIGKKEVIRGQVEGVVVIGEAVRFNGLGIEMKDGDTIT